MLTGVLIFVAAILVVVLIHELGHFVAARAFDFKATQFFVGFGPTLWSVRRGETEYGVKALPLGGFVKILGMNPYEEVSPADAPRAYPNKPRWQRALLLLAGSATHWPVAFAAIAATAMLVGYPAVTRVVADVGAPGGAPTPAAEAGFRPGDEILAVDGRRVEDWEEVRELIRSRPGRTVSFVVERSGRRVRLVATLGRALTDEETGRIVDYAPPGESLRSPRQGEEEIGFLGVAPRQEVAPMGPAAAVREAARQVVQITRESVAGIGGVFTPVFDGSLFEALTRSGERDPAGSPIGIVGAGRIAGQSVEAGRYLILVELIVRFTIFIGVINLLPLPPLDGGHLAVVAYEAVTRRRVDVRKLIPVAAAVISFFVVLFVTVLYLDLARPVNLDF